MSDVMAAVGGMLFLGVWLAFAAGVVFAGQVAYRRLIRKGYKPFVCCVLIGVIDIGAAIALIRLIAAADPSTPGTPFEILVTFLPAIGAAAVLVALPVVLPQRRRNRSGGKRTVKWPLLPLALLSYVCALTLPVYWIFDAYGTSRFVKMLGQAPLVGMILFGVGSYFVALRTRVQRPGALEIVEEDARPPVLYLRAFASEVQTFHTLRARDATKLTHSLSALTSRSNQWIQLRFEDFFDEAIEKHLGPFVALGNPEDYVPPEGAFRLYSADSEWQSHVLALARRAQAIVLEAGSSANLGWELTSLSQQRLTAKLLVFTSPERTRRAWAAEQWNNWLDRASGREPVVWPQFADMLARFGYAISSETPAPGTIFAFNDRGHAKVIHEGANNPEDYVLAMKAWLQDRAVLEKT